VQCKYCNSDKITKNGHDLKRNQRYKCPDCKHTFALESKSWIPIEFISWALYTRDEYNKTNFPNFVNFYLRKIGYDHVHRTTVYSWIRKYNEQDLIPYQDALEWLQKHVKKIQERHPETPKKNLTPKEEAHKQSQEDKLLGTHIEFLTWIQSILGKKQFMFMEKYQPKLIEQLIDSFNFEKYKENQSEIDAIVKKRILSDK